MMKFPKKSLRGFILLICVIIRINGEPVTLTRVENLIDRSVWLTKGNDMNWEIKRPQMNAVEISIPLAQEEALGLLIAKDDGSDLASFLVAIAEQNKVGDKVESTFIIQEMKNKQPFGAPQRSSIVGTNVGLRISYKQGGKPRKTVSTSIPKLVSVPVQPVKQVATLAPASGPIFVYNTSTSSVKQTVLMTNSAQEGKQEVAVPLTLGGLTRAVQESMTPVKNGSNELLVAEFLDKISDADFASLIKPSLFNGWVTYATFLRPFYEGKDKNGNDRKERLERIWRAYKK